MSISSRLAAFTWWPVPARPLRRADSCSCHASAHSVRCIGRHGREVYGSFRRGTSYTEASPACPCATAYNDADNSPLPERLSRTCLLCMFPCFPYTLSFLETVLKESK